MEERTGAAEAGSRSSTASPGGDGSAAGDRHQREVEAKWKGNK